MSTFTLASEPSSPMRSSSSSSDYDSDLPVGSTNVGTFVVRDNLGEQFTKCCARIDKYLIRKSQMVRSIKQLRALQKALPKPSKPVPIPTLGESQPNVFTSNKVDDRLFSEVVLVPSSSSEEELILDVPKCKSYMKLIMSIQRQINLTNWRLDKQIKKKEKLNKLIANQVQYSPIYNPTIVYQPTTVPIPSNEYQPFHATATSTKRIKNIKNKSSINCDLYGIYTPKFNCVRNKELSIKLRIKIRSFRNIITDNYITFLLYYKFKLLNYPIYPQMDAHGEEVSPSPDKKLNTVIATQRDASEGSSKPIIYPEWCDLVSSDHFSSYPTSLDRWTKFKTITWKGTNFTEPTISLPSDLLTELKNTPLFIPFRNNRYWKGDFEFKFVLNSNKFQLGSLQISFIYCSNLEQGFKTYRSNIYSASQTNHCILNAGSSNEGILKIPFKYFNPVITTNPGENVDYCKIFIRVLNTLQCTSSTYNSCDLSIFVNLNNAYFTGSIDFSLIESPQMFHLMRALVKTAEFGLNQLDADNNRDNPPDVMPPSTVLVTNASSWCVGTTSVDSVVHLRLDASGQTPHPNLSHDELKTNVICRIFGLVNTFDWKYSHRSGDNLLVLEAAPMANLLSYYSSIVTVADRQYSLYNLPPVAVMSNLFAYWRGSLEIRLDFVATSFHTGSLLIAYIPGILKSVTIDQARSSNYVVCSLQEKQSYTIRVPYISNSPSWPRKYNKSYKIKQSVEINPPGTIQIFVLNPLIPIENVVSTVQVNYYLRAGDDFELLVPIQPNISTPYNLDYKDAQYNELPLLNADQTSKSTVFNYCISSPPGYPAMITLINKPLTDTNVIDYELLRDGKFIKPNQDLLTDLNNFVPQKPGLFNYYLDSALHLEVLSGDGTNNKSTKFFVLYNELCGSEGVTTLWPVKNLNVAKTYVKSEQSWSDLMKAVIPMPKINANTQTLKIIYLTKIFVHHHKTSLESDLESEFSYCDVNNEERSLSTTYMDMTQNLKSTDFGLNLYGEQFNDLKDYCRRYQYYTSVNYVAPTTITKKQAIAIVPLVPQGLINPVVYRDGSINHIVNRCKDGFIPIISSGYRFYRGGLRIRIVCDSRRNVNLWVQHRPEMLLKFLQTHLIDPDNQSLSDYFNHSYSFTIQNLSLNNVLSLEIPWYSKNMLGCCFLPKVLSSDTDINSQKLTSFSLGSLVLGLDADTNELNSPLNLDLYYSIADDFHFNTFQGFPLMLTLDQIPVTYALPQMGFFSKQIEKNPTVKKVDNLVTKIDGITDKVTDFMSELPNLISTNFSGITADLRQVIATVFFSIAHIVESPTRRTWIIAIAAIFTKIGLIVGDAVVKLYKILSSLIKKIFSICGFSKKEEELKEPAPAESQPSTSVDQEAIITEVNSDADDTSDVCSGFVSLVWAAINTLLNVSFKTCETFGDCASTLFDGIAKGASQANIMFRFLKNCFKVFEKVYKYIIDKIAVKYNRYQRLQVEEETLQEWLDLCDNLLSPLNSNLVQNDLQWREAVYCAARYGHLYLCKQKPGISPRVDIYIRKIYDKIINLRDSLQNEKLFPSLRMEAYGIWLDGAPGIGKSSMVTRLSTDLLNSINYKGSSNLIFNVTPLDKYWNNCNHQPVVSVDDAFAITTPECIQNQLWTYFTVMSPVPLIPPMAEIKDKKMHYNPEIMITCSNQAFPKVVGIAEEAALFRRRHQLVKVQLVDASKLTYPFGCTDAELKEFKHLNFSLAQDVRDPKTKYSAPMTYSEFITFLKRDFSEFKRRSAYAYEERKRLQFSMMTDSEAKKLPDNKKILDYLAEFDSDNKTKLMTENNTEQEPLTNIYNLIDKIQQNRHFSIKLRVKIPEDPTTSQNLLEIAQDIKEQANVLIEPSMMEPPEPTTGEPIPEEEIDWDAALTPLSPEELKKNRDNIDEYMLLHQREEQRLLDKLPKDGLTKMQTAIDADMSGNPITGVLYVSRFSPFASILINLNAYPKDKYKKNIGLSSLVGGLALYNEELINSCRQINKLRGIIPRNCVHYLIDHCTRLVRRDYMGATFTLWEVPVSINSVSCNMEYDPKSSQSIFISDVPCMDTGCLVAHPKLWSERVSRWLPKGLRYNPWLLCHDDTPVISHAIQTISKFRRFVASLQACIVKTVKFCLYDVFYKSMHWMGSIICGMGTFLSGLAGLLGLVGAFKLIKGPKPQLVSSGDSTTKNAPNNARKIIFNAFAQSVEGNDRLLNTIRARIVKNTVYINFENKKKNKISNMKCLIIKDRYLLVLRHYIEYLECNQNEDTTVKLLWVDCGSHTFNFKDYDISWCKDSNIGILKLGTWFSSRRSLLPFISNHESFNGGLARDCTILDCNYHETLIYEQNITLVENVTIAPTSYSKTLIMPNAYAYKKNYPGMCGSALLTSDFREPIIGIHVAGANGRGFSEPICRSQFIKYFNHVENNLQDDIDPVDWRTLDTKQLPVEERKLFLNGTHTYLGNIDKSIAKYEMGLTSILPSTIQGVFPVKTEPGPLTPKDPRINNEFSPLLSGCEKHCNVTIDFNKEDLKDAEQDLKSLILSNVKPIRLDVNALNEYQAINGIEGLEDYRPLVWNTSEGFYLSRFRPKDAHDKRWLFNFENDKATSVHPNLREVLDSKHNDRLNNIVPLTIHDDCLKDARLPLAKIKIPGKVRIFSISPVDFTIQFRQYFLDFIAAYTRSRFNCEHAIGINVHGTEWTDLAKKFINKKIITGDYSGFGPSLNSEVVCAAFRIINAWYTTHGCDAEDNQIRIIMRKELVNAKHLMGDYLYEVSCGLPSGNPATVIFNSLVNSLYLRCAWLDIMRNTIYNSLVDQRKFMTIITYGDDLIASIDDKVIDKFNNNSLSFFFKKHDIIFTDAAKTGVNVEPYIDLSKATFLKHAFMPHPKRDGFYLAQLDQVSVTECANWIRKSKDPIQATVDNCIQGSMLAYGHGPQFYDEYNRVVREALFKAHGIEFQVRTWDQLDHLFLMENYYFDW